ncbi:MAG: FAD-dependent oxidoreductase [Hyphomicrobiales bacterium]|nr:FAD-dependent oxidoreductase [Hyphomicrobiales bacterium]
MSDPRSIVIIGAGECGIRAALTLRDEGYTGEIALIHGEAVEPYEKPPLSKPGLEGISIKPISGTDRVLKENITVYHDQRVTTIERATKSVSLANGEMISYDRLLLATGARARALMIDGHEIQQARLFRDYSDAKAFFDVLSPDYRLTIIGGGFIGLELAAAARQRRVQTTVIESATRLLGRAVPEGLAARIEARHREEQVHFHIGQSVSSISPTRKVTLADGTEIMSDIILAGIGSIPNTELAEQCRLTIDNGVVVDATFRTSDPDIFAAGDCCSFPHALYGMKRMRLESWRAAQEQGAHAARAMLGASDPYQSVPWFWSDQYDLTLQIAGLPSEGVTMVTRMLDDESEILFHLDAEGRLVGASGLSRGNKIAKDIRLAEMLIAKRSHPEQQALADPKLNLKSLLKA